MDERGKSIQINFTLTNRWLYTLMAFLVIAIAGVGVYAFTNPSTGVGHEWDEINVPADIADGDDVGVPFESDPTVNAYIKNKGSCAAITGGSTLCDGNDANSFCIISTIPVFGFTLITISCPTTSVNFFVG